MVMHLNVLEIFLQCHPSPQLFFRISVSELCFHTLVKHNAMKSNLRTIINIIENNIFVMLKN